MKIKSDRPFKVEFNGFQHGIFLIKIVTLCLLGKLKSFGSICGMQADNWNPNWNFINHVCSMTSCEDGFFTFYMFHLWHNLERSVYCHDNQYIHRCWFIVPISSDGLESILVLVQDSEWFLCVLEIMVQLPGRLIVKFILDFYWYLFKTMPCH